jgi:hypothetical protein
MNFPIGVIPSYSRERVVKFAPSITPGHYVMPGAMRLTGYRRKLRKLNPVERAGNGMETAVAPMAVPQRVRFCPRAGERGGAL